MNNVMRLGAATAFLAVLCGSAGAAKNPANLDGFDLQKTAGFMREMETRPDFPVSTVLANDYVYSLTALGQRVSTAQRAAALSYFKKAQHKDGGFGADTADRNSTVVSTALAVETLGYLKGIEAIDGAGVKSFVFSLKNSDGGFGFSRVSPGSTLAATYQALRILKSMEALGTVDSGGIARFVKGFERAGGGFGYVKGNSAADVKSTCMALAILNMVGRLENATRAGALKYLAATPYLNARSKERPELDDELNAIVALKELRAPGKIDRKIATAFLKQVYVPLNGGFGPLVGYGSTPDSTTTALHILAELGGLKGAGGTVRRARSLAR